MTELFISKGLDIFVNHSKLGKHIMNSIYLISQPDTWTPYGSIRSAIVVADSVKNAQQIHPGRGWSSSTDGYPEWVKTPEEVRVSRLGIADPSLPKGVILSSMNIESLDDGK